MINAKHIGRVALFIVTGFCLSSLGGSVQAKTPDLLSIPGLTFVVSSDSSNPTHQFTFTELNATPATVMKSTKPTPSLLELFVSPTPTILPLEAASDSAHISMITQEITEKTVTPTPTVQPTVTPEISSTTPTSPVTAPNLSPLGGLNADVLFQMVQDYRAKMGLPAFQKNDQVCSLANSRAPEVGEEIADGHMHSGLKARNLPYWNTENIISMRNEAEAFNWWINDYIHKKAIESNNQYSCMACNGDSCAEEFTSLEPK